MMYNVKNYIGWKTFKRRMLIHFTLALGFATLNALHSKYITELCRCFLLKTSDAWKNTSVVADVWISTTLQSSGSKQSFQPLWRITDLWVNSHFKGFHVWLSAAAACLSVIQTLHWLLCLFGEWPQHHALISPLTVLGVEVVLVNIFYHTVWDQVFDTQSSSQSPPHLCGTRLIPHPFPHQVNVLSVPRKRVRFVYSHFRLQPPSTDAD